MGTNNTRHPGPIIYTLPVYTPTSIYSAKPLFIHAPCLLGNTATTMNKYEAK
jgi:hypothetical protein